LESLGNETKNIHVRTVLDISSVILLAPDVTLINIAAELLNTDIKIT